VVRSVPQLHILVSQNLRRVSRNIAAVQFGLALFPVAGPFSSAVDRRFSRREKSRLHLSSDFQTARKFSRLRRENNPGVLWAQESKPPIEVHPLRRPRALEKALTSVIKRLRSRLEPELPSNLRQSSRNTADKTDEFRTSPGTLTGPVPIPYEN